MTSNTVLEKSYKNGRIYPSTGEDKKFRFITESFFFPRSICRKEREERYSISKAGYLFISLGLSVKFIRFDAALINGQRIMKGELPEKRTGQQRISISTWQWPFRPHSRKGKTPFKLYYKSFKYVHPHSLIFLIRCFLLFTEKKIFYKNMLKILKSKDLWPGTNRS